MSPPIGTGGGPPGEGAALVADVERYVAEWRKLVVQGVRAGASVDAQVRVSSGLQDRARRASFGGLAHHLSRIDAIASGPGGVNPDAMVAPLRDVSDFVEQIKHALTDARAPSGPPLGSAQGAVGPPRMVTHMPLGAGARTGGQPMVPPKVEISMKVTPPPSPSGGPILGLGRNANPAPARPMGQMGQLSPLPLDSPAMPPMGSPSGAAMGQLSPLPLDMPRDPALTGPMAMPGQLRSPGGLPPPGAAPPPGPSGFVLPPLEAAPLQAAPYQAPPLQAPPYQPPPAQASPLQASPLPAPPPLATPSSFDGPSGGGGSQSMRTGAPKLMVRTMFGLRAFGRQKTDGTPAAPERPGSILGLRSLSSEAGPTPQRDSAMPKMLNNSLPPLPGAPRGAEDDAGPPPSLFGELLKRRGKTGSQKVKVRDRDSGPRRIREAGAPPPRQRGLRRRGDRGSGSLVWAYVALGVIALGSIITVIVLVVKRSQSPTVVPTADTATATPSGSAVVASTASSKKTELPREKFVMEDEGLKSMLGMIHGKGKESAELRALVDDQAALLHRMVTTQKCQGSTEACDQWNEAKELLNADSKKIERRRVNAEKQLKSRWLAGLNMPDIPIEDDPRVQRAFESITVNPLGRERFVSMLFRCGAHWDLIKATLQRYELPQALLAVVFTESGCSPKIDSPVGAMGLWQFMPETGRAYHLRIIEEKLDERMSPVKSTEAAVHYLSDLKQKLNSWDLVFASYNLGPYGVLARLRKAGDDVGFWDLVDAEYLPDETANYVPYIQAYALVLANLRKLNFAGAQISSPAPTADLEVASGTRLTLVARVASTSLSNIHSLNPDILSELVPAVPSQRFVVQVPKDNVWQARDMLAALVAQSDESDLCVPNTFDWGKQRFTDEMKLACGKKLSAPLPVPVPLQ